MISLIILMVGLYYKAKHLMILEIRIINKLKKLIDLN